MKPQTQKQISLDRITGALATHSLADARALLTPSAGATMAVSGTVLKVAKRDIFRLVIMANAGSHIMEIYANFTDPAEQQKVLDPGSKREV